MPWRAVKGAALLLVLAALAACTSTSRFGGPDVTTAAPPAPAAAAEPPPPPPPPVPPPVDLAGKWKLSAAAGGACVMTFGNAPNTVNTGTIAPAGGCPGSFFTSRKWSFEDNMLNIRDYKGAALAQLSFADGGFGGKDADGGAVTLARPR